MGKERFKLIRDLLSFLKQRKKWWLLPLILMLLFVGILIIVGQSAVVPPFIYPFF